MARSVICEARSEHDVRRSISADAPPTRGRVLACVGVGTMVSAGGLVGRDPMWPVLFGVRIASDGEISLLYAGEGWAALFGRAHPACVEDPFCPHPEDKQRLLDSLRAAARAGKPWHHSWRVR